MKFITRAQELGKKAAELSQAVHALPAKAAQLREAVTMTGGELKQLRGDVQSGLHALRADNEDRLLAAMREINDHTQVFAEAGYDLTGMDLDLAIHQRLAVHLDKVEEVSHARIRALRSGQTSETVRSILNGIMKAEETAASVELSQLVYGGLVVHVGPIPTIRMNWYQAASTPAVEAPPPQAASAPPSSVPESRAESGSMFDLRPLPGGIPRVETTPTPSGMVPHPVAPAGVPAPASSSWSQDALARFKTMPGISKYKK
jgi:hypothetical protein